MNCSCEHSDVLWLKRGPCHNISSTHFLLQSSFLPVLSSKQFFLILSYTKLFSFEWNKISSPAPIYKVLTKCAPQTVSEAFSVRKCEHEVAVRGYSLLKNINPKIHNHIYISSLKLWNYFIPIHSIVLLTAYFFSSLMKDTRTNPTEFSRPFYLGVIDGFWWAFVTMSTVG